MISSNEIIEITKNLPLMVRLSQPDTGFKRISIERKILGALFARLECI